MKTIKKIVSALLSFSMIAASAVSGASINAGAYQNYYSKNNDYNKIASNELTFDYNNDSKLDDQDLAVLLDFAESNSTVSMSTLMYDINGDYNIDMDDYNTLKAYLLQKKKSDYNSDGVIDFNDFYYLEKKINRILSLNNYKPLLLHGNDPYKVYDYNFDEVLSYHDYLDLLDNIQNRFNSIKFSFEFNKEETYLKLTNCGETDAEEITVPYEAYYKGKILPVMEISGNAFDNCKNLKKLNFSNYIQPEWINDKQEEIATAGKVTAGTYLDIDAAVFCLPGLEKVNFPSHVNITGDTGKINKFVNTFTGNSYEEADNIKYLNSSDGKACLAYSVEKGSEKLVFKNGTTSVNKRIAVGDSIYYYIKEIILPSSVDYIGDNAFIGCINASKFNGKEYADSDDFIKKLFIKYLSAFDYTKFNVKATQAVIESYYEDISSRLSDPTETELVNAIGKKICDNVKYRYYATFDEKEKNNGWNCHYANQDYHTSDYCRGSVYSPSACFFLDTTECEGYSYGAALMFNRFNIDNVIIGAPGHAYNAVKIGDYYRRVDNTIYQSDTFKNGNNNYFHNYFEQTTKLLAENDKEISGYWIQERYKMAGIYNYKHPEKGLKISIRSRLKNGDIVSDFLEFNFDYLDAYQRIFFKKPVYSRMENGDIVPEYIDFNLI